MSETSELVIDIVTMARENDQFREVIWTGEEAQLVLMAIPEGGEIGGETHEGHDQLLYFVAGEGKAKIGDEEMDVKDGSVAIVPSGKFHNFTNTGSGMLKLYTTYSPPEHEAGTEHDTKAEADAA